MVGNNPQGHVFFLVSQVLGMGHGADFIHQRLVGIYRKQGVCFLHHHGQTFQAHAGINVFLF